MVRVVTVVGARPQFVKAAAVARALSASPAGKSIQHELVHTGQHHDDNMSRVFFEQLRLPAADVNLGISGGAHGEMTGQMLAAIEKILVDRRPDWVLVYGDTNSTLAAALAAAKLHVPVAHVEAGLRSFNRRMPEEINRVLTDHLSAALFCPTGTAVANLAAEGITAGVHLNGDVMLDAALFYREEAAATAILRDLSLAPGQYFLATCHRAENTDEPQRLREILLGLAAVARLAPVVLPLHPRTRKLVQSQGLELDPAIMVVPPVGYLEMIALESNARAILTDSGGVQKEAYFFQVPCLTLRGETEWVETVNAGWNELVEPSPAALLAAVERATAVRKREHPRLFGDGTAAAQIVEMLSGKPAEERSSG